MTWTQVGASIDRSDVGKIEAVLPRSMRQLNFGKIYRYSFASTKKMLPGTEAKNMTHPASDATKFWDSIILRGFVIALYLGLNISLNLLNKWTLTLYGFNLPLFMSLAHMGFSFLALLPIMLMRSFYDLHVPTLQKQWPGILAISSFFAMNVGAQIYRNTQLAFKKNWLKPALDGSAAG